MCFGGPTGDIDDENEGNHPLKLAGSTTTPVVPKGQLPVSAGLIEKLVDFRTAFKPPIRFIVLNVVDGKVTVRAIPVSESGYKMYESTMTSIIDLGKMAIVYHWFKDDDQTMYLKITFIPEEEINEEEKEKFFATVNAYEEKELKNVEFLELNGSTEDEISYRALEAKYEDLRYG